MIGNNIIELAEVDSTNLFANQLLKEKRPVEGTVAWALEQSAGKGQGANKWTSETGKNLTFTILLYPGFLPADQQFFLNKVISLGVMDYVFSAVGDQKRVNTGDKKYDPPVISIKWPNDIYAGNRKIAGILIEHQILGNRIGASVIGIGLNINQTAFPEDVPNPVSLKQLTGVDYDLRQELVAVCRAIDLRWMVLKEIGPATLDHTYASHLLGYGLERTYNVAGKLMEGVIVGVDNYGKLILHLQEGQYLALSHEEVKYII
jgi:BirA family biotin operon repressor/biotin-[acetyl-CoA-carboxylase] ligase